MSFLSSFFKKKNDEEPEKVITSNIETEDEDEIAAVIAAALASMDEEETVAAITAAIAVMLGSSTSDFIVRNIKRTPEMDPMWAMAGRMKLMR